MKNINKKILTLPLRLAIIVVIMGALFKIMHWSSSNVLLFFGGISIGILYPIRFFYKKPKLRLDYVKLCMVLLWLTNYLNQVFYLYEIPFLIEICLIILYGWWLIEEGFHTIKSRKFKKKGIAKTGYYLLAVVSFLCILFGVLFKIQHWPYGSLLFAIGITSLCVVLLLDYFIIETNNSKI